MALFAGYDAGYETKGFKTDRTCRAYWTMTAVYKILLGEPTEHRRLGKRGVGGGMAQLPVVGQGLLIIDALRAHSDTTLGRTPLEEFSVRRRYAYKALRSTPRVR